MAGRKPITINLKSTSPEGEVKFFKTIREAAIENWDSVSVELEKLFMKREIKLEVTNKSGWNQKQILTQNLNRIPNLKRL